MSGDTLDLFIKSDIEPAATEVENGLCWYTPNIGQVYMWLGTWIPIAGGTENKSYMIHDPFAVFINGLNKTELIKNVSFNKSDKLTNKVDTCNFILWDIYGTSTPSEGHSVAVYSHETGSVIFNGEILRFTQTDTAGPGQQKYEYMINCVDWQKRLQQKLVIDSYTNQTLSYIVNDIVTNYTSGYTTNNVQTGPTISYISFRYKNPAKCFKELAKISGFDWYVDEDKDIHFFSSATNLAPYSLTDNNDTTGHYKKLKIKVDKSQYRNRIIIQGGYYLSPDYTQEIVADGSQNEFLLAYPPKAAASGAIEVYVDTGGGYVQKTLGIDNITTSGKDFVVAQTEKLIKNLDLATLSDGDKLKVIYQYDIPILTQDDDTASQDAIIAIEGGDGIYEHHISDSTIETIAAAHERADADLRNYANALIKGSFVTDQSGYRSGQLLTVNMPSRGYTDRTFLIQAVRTKLRKGGSYVEYTVQFATYLRGLTDFLIDLHEAGKEIIVRPDETLHDLSKPAKETVTITGTTPTLTEYTPPFQYGPGGSPQGVYNESEYS